MSEAAVAAVDEASSSNPQKIEVWYAFSWPEDPLKPYESEVRERGKMLELDKELEDWEFKDMLRREHKLSAPLLLYYINRQRGSSWSMCVDINFNSSPWFLKVEAGTHVDADELQELEASLEMSQWIFDCVNQRAYERLISQKPEEKKFKVYYATSMPAAQLKTLEQMRRSYTLFWFDFPDVPTVGQLKKKLHNYSIEKSWPVKYLDRTTGVWVSLNLVELEDDVPLSNYGTNERVDIIFECPKNIFSLALPHGVKCDSYLPPTQDCY